MKKPGYVYFLVSDALKMVKIGYSVDPRGRARNIAGSSPAILTFVGAIRGNYQDESCFHRRFKKERSHGEWFRFSDRIETFLANPMTNCGYPLLLEGFEGMGIGEIIEPAETKYRDIVKLVKRRRRTRKQRKRPSYSRTELLRFLKENDIHSTGGLRKRDFGENPTLADYLKEFRFWNRAMEETWGSTYGYETWDAEQMIRFALDNDIKTRDAWAQNPDCVSFHQVKNTFGTWGAFCRECYRVRNERDAK